MLCRRNVYLTVKMSHYARKGTKNSEINKKIGRKNAIPTGFYGFGLYFCIQVRDYYQELEMGTSCNCKCRMISSALVSSILVSAILKIFKSALNSVHFFIKTALNSVQF